MKDLCRQWVTRVARGRALGLACGFLVMTLSVIARESLKVDEGLDWLNVRVWWAMGAATLFALWAALQQAREDLTTHDVPRAAYVLVESLNGAALPLALFAYLWLISGRPAMTVMALAPQVLASSGLGLVYAVMGLGKRQLGHDVQVQQDAGR